MPSCLECFNESGLEGRELQRFVDAQHPEFGCEKEPVSPHSPGPVTDEERVAFILIDPLHYDKERDVVVPDAFQELTKRDLSTLRVGHATQAEANATREELIQRGEARVIPQLRQVNEVCVAAVSELRTANDGNKRLLGVYDTALERVRSHASIFTRGDVLDCKRLRKVVRNRIHEILSKTRQSYDDFVNSLPPA